MQKKKRRPSFTDVLFRKRRSTGAVFISLFIWAFLWAQEQGDGLRPDYNDLVTFSDGYVSSPLHSNLYIHTSEWIVNPFDRIPQPIFGMDSVSSLRGVFDVRYDGFERWAEVSYDWSVIVIYEAHNGLLFKIPFAAPMDWYFQQRITQNRYANFYEVMKGESKEKKKQRGQKIEVFGLDTGAGRVSLNISGNITITGKMVFQDQELARSSFREAQTTHFEFDERQQLRSEGKIGDRVSVFLDWDSERDFDWENNIRIHYFGKEDEIIQKIEAGNISLSLPSTQFVSFSGSSKGLFGIKSIMKLGPVDITSIASIEQTKKEKKKFKGGTESQGQAILDYRYRKNQYFFIDQVFRDGGLVLDDDGIPQFHSQTESDLNMPGFYPLDELGRHLLGNVVVSEIEVFKDVGATPGSGTFYGLTYVDPVFKNGRWKDRAENADTTNNGFFRRLVRNVDYFISEDLGFIRLTTPVQIERIAVSYQLSERKVAEQDPIVIIKNVGELTFDIEEGDTIHLKLIKPDDPRPSHPTWPLAFKNVYYLGASNINKEGFTLEIIFKNGALGDNIYDENGNTFLNLFGLDNFDENGALNPDDLMDLGNPNILSLVSGELIFPMLHPFEMDSLAGTDKYRGEGNTREELRSVLPDSALMYRGTVDQQIRNESKFDIRVTYTNTSSTINLGGFMLVEGSEEVRLNNVLLQKDKDYVIDYFTGTLTFLTDAINDPSADLEILYEKHELVSFDKKTIVGARAQMDIGKKSFLGMTALFYNQSVINEKIEVGYEPTKNFIWDINGRYESEINLLTQAIDKLPLIETTKPSLFTIEGEYAQVLPNPNPINNESTGDRNGVAYIDDFEGAKRTTSPSINQRFWNRSSVPIGMDLTHRAQFFWYNPFTQYRTRDIWPNLDTGIRAGNELTDILRLNYKRRSGVLQDSSWAGITTSFYTSDYNQTGSKFFEIWLLGDEGKITVDLGFISEDQNNNNKFDTEDKPISGLPIGNTLLEEEEDIGLDGCVDSLENGFGGCLDEYTFQEVRGLGLDSLVYMGEDIDFNDPNSDNWSFNQNDVERPRKYRFLNGTERNGYPPAGLNPLEGALYPDTEDINRNGTFDVRDDYLTFTFDLSETSDDWFNYQGGLTETGWRLYRIPFAAFQKARDGGDITWDTIKFMRLVVSGIEDSTEVWIAKLEMVGNDWQELGVRANLAEDYVIDDSVFAITVVNTDDNLEYAQSVEEIGVQGEYDRLNEVRLKEQSLVLKFTDLGPGEEGAAQKNLFELRGDKAQSYLTYKKLKLFTYGASDHSSENTSDVEFFIRFGRADDYYELRQPVYKGWDSKLKRNFIEIDLDFLTDIKVLNPEIDLPPNHIFTASDTSKEYIITSEDGVDTLKRYYIQGAPSLSRLQYFIVGVKNTHPDSSISGEVWIDELRLSGVRKDVGTAFRVQSKLQLADVGNVTVSYNRKDADFHVLQKRLGSGRRSEKFRIDSRISIDKLFPQQWGLKLPLSMGFTNNVTTPKYIPGSDIRLNEDAIPDSVLEEMLTTSEQISLTTSFSKSTKSDHWYTRYSIDKIKVNFSGSRGLESNEQTARRFTRNYTGGTSYNLPFGRDNYVSPLKFLKNVPWLGEKVGKTHLYYTPSSIDLSANVSETFTETTPRVGDYKEIYNMGLSRNFKVNYTILENLKTNYNKNIKSDMNQFRSRHLDAVKNLNPGVVSDVTENLTTTFNPTILSWLKPSLNYNSNYRWSKPKDSTQEGATIQSQQRFSSSITLTLKSIIETVYTPPRKSRTTRRRGKTRVAPSPDEQEKKKKKRPNEGIQSIFKGIYAAVSRVNPINITYSENQSQNAYQVIGSPDLTYRFGFSDELGLDHSEDAGVNRGSRNFQYDFSIRSGLNLIKQVSTNFNFSNNRSLSIDGNNIRTKSETRDYFPNGVKGDKGFPIPGWNVRITGVEKWPIINLLSKSATFEHAFSGKESRSWQNNEKQSSKYTSSFSPLAGFSMTLVKNISLSTRYSIVNSVDNRFGGINSTRLKKDRTFTASTNYTHRGGLRIPIVFFRDFNLENTINFTLSLDFSDSKTKERNKEGVKLTTTSEQKSWKISPRISYSFTRRVTGGIWYEYRESESKVIGRKIDRDFGFEVNIAIQG